MDSTTTVNTSDAFMFNRRKIHPRDLPTFFEEPEPPDIDSKKDNSDAKQ